MLPSSGGGDTVGVLGTVVDAPKLGVVRGLENNGAAALIIISKSTGIIQSIQRTDAASARRRVELTHAVPSTSDYATTHSPSPTGSSSGAKACRFDTRHA